MCVHMLTLGVAGPDEQFGSLYGKCVDFTVNQYVCMCVCVCVCVCVLVGVSYWMCVSSLQIQI